MRPHGGVRPNNRRNQSCCPATRHETFIRIAARHNISYVPDRADRSPWLADRGISRGRTGARRSSPPSGRQSPAGCR